MGSAALGGRSPDERALDEVRFALWPEEEVLWVGAAEPLGLDAFGGHAVIVWTGAITLVMVALLAGGAQGPFSRPLLVLGIWLPLMLVQLLMVWRRTRAATRSIAYVVTTRRAIARAAGQPIFEVPAHLLVPSAVLRRNGRRSVLELGQRTSPLVLGLPWRHSVPVPTFADVADGAGAMAALTRARASVGREGGPVPPASAATVGHGVMAPRTRLGVDHEVLSTLRSSYGLGERELWVGRPHSLLADRQAILPLTVPLVVSGAFAWWASQGSGSVLASVVPFLVVATFWGVVVERQRAGTVYVVTSRRALSLDRRGRGFALSIADVSPTTLATSRTRTSISLQPGGAASFLHVADGAALVASLDRARASAPPPPPPSTRRHGEGPPRPHAGSTLPPPPPPSWPLGPGARGPIS